VALASRLNSLQLILDYLQLWWGENLPVEGDCGLLALQGFSAGCSAARCISTKAFDASKDLNTMTQQL
jgi:hypothetical protein